MSPQKRLRSSTQTQAILTAKASYTTSLLQVDKSQAVLDKLKRGTDPKENCLCTRKVAEAETSSPKSDAVRIRSIFPLQRMPSPNVGRSLASAQHKLADAEDLRSYAIKAPFDGLIANIQTQEHDQISSGAPVTAPHASENRPTLLNKWMRQSAQRAKSHARF